MSTPAVKTSEQSVQLNQLFDFPIAQVYEAWTQPEFFQQWFARFQPLEVRKVELDVRVGGKWEYKAQLLEDQRLMWISGEYQEVIPNQKLVFTWNMKSGSVLAENTLVSVTFRELDKQTEITLTHERFVDTQLVKAHGVGWTKGFECLNECLGKAV